MPIILIVDDEEGFLNILSIVLTRAGYQVITANNALEAQEKLKSIRPDLIILDDMMPFKSGSDLCYELKHDPDWQNVPVIMHSAGVNIANRAHIERIRADGVIPKPSSPKELVAFVQRYVPARAG